MKVLRDLRLSTELLILSEIIKNSHFKMKDMAEKLDITVQGVSEYLKRMKGEDLIQNIAGEHRVTKKGIELLHSNFTELKEFVDTKIMELNIIDMCAALAKTSIKKGEEVGLFMENGVLVAYSKKESESKGVAQTDAKEGEDVAISDLSGIISLSPGMMHIVKLPSINEGGSRSVSPKDLRDLHQRLDPQKTAVMDVVSIAAAKKADIRTDFQFAALDSAIESTQKGLNVMILASSDQIPNVVSSIEEVNSQIEDKIIYQIVNL